jgi:hypothetical protein
MKIIQIGCNDGKDHVFKYVLENVNNIEDLYLIDANKNCVEACKEQYKNIEGITYLHYAITFSDEEFVDLCIPNNNETTSGHSSLIEDHLKGHNYFNYRKEKVPAKNINKLFQELNLKIIDRLYIDTEGLDVDIVNNIDFDQIEIKFLMFEYIHSDGTLTWGGGKLQKCLNRLESLGYSISKEEYNVIAQK